MMMERDLGKWQVAWSHQTTSQVASLCHLGDGVAIASGMQIEFINQDGNIRWRQQFSFPPYRIRSAGGIIGVLVGTGFHLLRKTDGSALHEGRATAGGFSDILERPGGGWVLSDRSGHLHIFNAEGKGIRRLNS